MEKDSKNIHKAILDVFLEETDIRNDQQKMDDYQLSRMTRDERIKAREKAKELADAANKERAERDYKIPDQKLETGHGDVKVVSTTPSKSTIRDPNVMDTVKGTPFMDQDFYRGTLGPRKNQEYQLGYIDTPYEDSQGNRIFPNNPETGGKLITPKVKKESLNYIKNKLIEKYLVRLSEENQPTPSQLLQYRQSELRRKEEQQLGPGKTVEAEPPPAAPEPKTAIKSMTASEWDKYYENEAIKKGKEYKPMTPEERKKMLSREDKKPQKPRW